MKHPQFNIKILRRCALFLMSHQMNCLNSILTSQKNEAVGGSGIACHEKNEYQYRNQYDADYNVKLMEWQGVHQRYNQTAKTNDNEPGDGNHALDGNMGWQDVLFDQWPKTGR